MNLYARIHLITLLFLGLTATAQIADADAEMELKQRLGKIDATHPRLFFRDSEISALEAKIQKEPLFQGLLDHIVAESDALLDAEPVKREKVGRRLLGVSRTCLQRVCYLAFAARLTDSQVYLRRAEKEMLAAAAFEDWNPSHFLDVAEMTAALAIGYDWLYNDLDSEARNLIRDAIVEKGLKTSLEGGWWVTTDNNWNQVCHGGLTLGALAVLENEPDLAQRIIARALENLPRAMHEYEPDGVYPEGPSYWKYGTTYNVLIIAALESTLGSDFGLADTPGFMRSPDFYLHATGPAGLFFNFSDCGERGGVAIAMHWFAARRNDPSLLWAERKELEQFVEAQKESHTSGDRLLPFLLVWGSGLSDISPPESLHWKGDGRTPIATFRSSWDEDAAYLAIKGGSPGSNHAHMDTGSFVLDMGGVRWASDLGAQSYNSLESRGIDLWNKRQDSERWTVFRLSNLSHNTLVIDGQLQRVEGNSPIQQFSGDSSNPFAIVDTSPAYDGQLAKSHRGARLIGNAALVQDDLWTLDNTTTVRWAMTTQAKVNLTGKTTATLRIGDKTLALQVLAPKTADLSVIDVEDPPQEYDAENPNTRMITFETKIPASSSDTLVVFLTPETDPVSPPAIIPLANWTE